MLKSNFSQGVFIYMNSNDFQIIISFIIIYLNFHVKTIFVGHGETEGVTAWGGGKKRGRRRSIVAIHV